MFGNATELAHTRELIQDFKRPENGGRLQQRLLERVNDPNLDCWLADLYNNSNFLDRNGPLVPFSSFFYTHKICDIRQTQAERAAIITTAAFEYKLLLEEGKVKPATLNDQPTDMYLFQYLFNTSRLPQIGSDKMERFPGNDYVVVLHKNRAFKVNLQHETKRVSYEQIERIFNWILGCPDNQASNLGILTADDRNMWAKVRWKLVLHTVLY